MLDVKSPLVPQGPTCLIAKFLVKQLKDDWQNLLDIDISDEMWGVNEILLYRCQTSQLDFFMPLSTAGTRQLYADLRKFDWYYMPDKWEFEQAIKDLAACKNILEIGCGPGLFIEKALRHLPDSLLRGIELSEWAVERARANNLPVELIGLEKLIAAGNLFDAVCSFQVLEHDSQPYDLISAMVKILRPGGKLILSVPNQKSFLQYQYNLLDMPPHHMTRWCSNTFKYLEKLFPLKLIRINYEPLTKYHIDGFITAYARHWQMKLPSIQFLFSEKKLDRVVNSLRKNGLNRFLRGQGLYGLFEKP